MSASTPPSRPSSDSRLQIRIVPYSPPPPDSDAGSGSACASVAPSSRPVSYVFPSSSPAPEPPQQSTPVAPPCSSKPGLPIARAGPDEPPSLPFSSVSASPDSSSLADGRDDAVHAPAGRPVVPAAAWRSSPSSPSSRRRSTKVITVNADKTFSLTHQPAPTSAGRDARHLSSTSSLLSSCTTPSFWSARPSDPFTSETAISSPLTTLAEKSPPGPGSPGSSLSAASEPGSPSPSCAVPDSPWDYRLTGGLRKVPPTVGRKAPRRDSTSSSASSEPQLPSLPAPDADPARPPAPVPPIPLLPPKSSFQSSHSESTLSDRTNYKVYGQSSPAHIATGTVGSTPGTPDDASWSNQLDSPTSWSGQPNYKVFVGSSVSDPSLGEPSRPPTEEGDINYVVHSGPSASNSSLATTRSRVSRLRPQFSQESLVVAPLRPEKNRTLRQLAFVKSRSRESLRRASLTSLSSVIGQEATRALFLGGPANSVPASIQRCNSPADASSALLNCPQMLPSHPHQWSSQLSTIASESERDSATPTRSVSSFSGHLRRSSGFNSSHSRRVLSISSSSAGLDEASALAPGARSESVEQFPSLPPRSLPREPSGASRCLVRDHDEDGDGLADLHELRHHSSRTRMATNPHKYPSDRSLRSAATSRSNSFTNSAIIPLWARVYYGSGERRHLLARPSSESMMTEYIDSRPSSPRVHRSPSVERFTQTIFNPRRRPRDIVSAPPQSQSQPAMQPQPQSQTRTDSHASHTPQQDRRQGRTASAPRPATQESSMCSVEMGPQSTPATPQRVKKQTSSVWSPHLRRDQRASGYSIWEPPSAIWSADGGLRSRRNTQVVLFITGFIFPLAWMVASFLPLPLYPCHDMTERLSSTSQVHLPREPSHQMFAVQERRHYSARWWRTLNRGMSIIGLLLLGAAVALIVVGVQEQWG